MRFTRYRPVGWRGESYRHYLASKGVSTRAPGLYAEKLSSKMLRHGSLRTYDVGTQRQKRVRIRPYKQIKPDTWRFNKQVAYHKDQGRVVVGLEDPSTGDLVSEKVAVFKTKEDAEQWSLSPPFLRYQLRYYAKKSPPGFGDAVGAVSKEWNKEFGSDGRDGLKMFMDGVMRQTKHPVHELDERSVMLKREAGQKDAKVSDDPIERVMDRGATLFSEVLTTGSSDQFINPKKHARDKDRTIAVDFIFGDDGYAHEQQERTYPAYALTKNPFDILKTRKLPTKEMTVTAATRAANRKYLRELRRGNLDKEIYANSETGEFVAGARDGLGDTKYKDMPGGVIHVRDVKKYLARRGR